MKSNIDDLLDELNLSEEEYEKFKDLIEEARKRESEIIKNVSEAKKALLEYQKLLIDFAKMLEEEDKTYFSITEEKTQFEIWLVKL